MCFDTRTKSWGPLDSFLWILGRPWYDTRVLAHKKECIQPYLDHSCSPLSLKKVQTAAEDRFLLWDDQYRA